MAGTISWVSALPLSEEKKRQRLFCEYIMTKEPPSGGSFLCKNLVGVDFADKPVQRPGRQNFGQQHRRLIGKTNGIQRFMSGFQGDLCHERSGLGGIHAVLLVTLHALHRAAEMLRNCLPPTP